MKFINKNPPTEVMIAQENLDLSVLSVLGSSLASITPDQKHIPWKKNKRKETPVLSIIRKEPIP